MGFIWGLKGVIYNFVEIRDSIPVLKNQMEKTWKPRFQVQW